MQFEITPPTRDAVQAWIRQAGLRDDYLFPSRTHGSPHIGTRQYARILEHWVQELGFAAEIARKQPFAGESETPRGA